jgi:hypothetical protein
MGSSQMPTTKPEFDTTTQDSKDLFRKRLNMWQHLLSNLAFHHKWIQTMTQQKIRKSLFQAKVVTYRIFFVA